MRSRICPRDSDESTPAQLFERTLRSLRRDALSACELEWRHGRLALDPNQKPRCNRAQTLSSPSHDLLYMRALHITIGERRERGVQMRGHGVLVRRAPKCLPSLVSGLARRGCNSCPEWSLRQEPGKHESNGAHDRGNEENRVERRGESLRVRGASSGKKMLQGLGAHVARCYPSGATRRQQAREIGAQSPCEQGPENRGAERPSDQSEKRGSRCRHSEIAIVYIVLHRDYEHLHHHSKPDAENEHQQ